MVHCHRYQEENDKAASLIAETMNKDKDPFTLDLHYLFSQEAEDYLTRWLEMQHSDLARVVDKAERRRTLKVITGKGNHSQQGKSKLGPFVRKFLTKNGYR